MGGVWTGWGIPGEEGWRGNGAGRKSWREREAGLKRHRLCPLRGAETTGWGPVCRLVETASGCLGSWHWGRWAWFSAC